MINLEVEAKLQVGTVRDAGVITEERSDRSNVGKVFSEKSAVEDLSTRKFGDEGGEWYPKAIIVYSAKETVLWVQRLKFVVIPGNPPEFNPN